MGVLCDVYIADRERAKKYSFRGKCKCKSLKSCKCWEEYAFTTYDHIDSHRIYIHEFAMLLSVLRGKKHHDSVLEEFKMIVQFSENGPWIQKMPDDLPVLLAASTSKDLKSISKAWFEILNKMCPALVPDGDTPILEYLNLLHKLSKKSIQKKQKMYLWTCL